MFSDGGLDFRVEWDMGVMCLPRLDQAQLVPLGSGLGHLWRAGPGEGGVARFTGGFKNFGWILVTFSKNLKLLVCFSLFSRN